MPEVGDTADTPKPSGLLKVPRLIMGAHNNTIIRLTTKQRDKNNTQRHTNRSTKLKAGSTLRT